MVVLSIKKWQGLFIFTVRLRVMNKISNIVREEMNNIDGQEIKMTVLQDSESWKKSGRWSDDTVDNWFKTKLKNDTELGLGFYSRRTDYDHAYKSYKFLQRFAGVCLSNTGEI